MSDHNIIQIETKIKIVEDKQIHQIKESNLSYWDLNLFNEDISWASIDADLLYTTWDMLLTEVKSDETYKNFNIWIKICKNTCFAIEKSKKTPNTPRQEGFYEKKNKLQQNTEVNKSSNRRKCTKSDQRNWNNLKISINTEINLREKRAIAAIKKNPKCLYKFVKNNSTIRAGIEPLQDEERNLEPNNNKMSELLNEKYNSVFNTPDSTMTIKYRKDFLFAQGNTL